MKNKITVIILAHNSEKTIINTIKSVIDLDEIIIIDDESTDQTISLVKNISSPKIKIISRQLGSFDKQRNFGTNCASNDWVFQIDSDEIAEKALIDEIKKISICENYAYKIRFKEYMWGKICQYGLWGKSHIRLYNRKRYKWRGEVHEKIVPRNNQKIKLKRLQNYIIHYSHTCINKTLEKFNRYSSEECSERLKKHRYKSKQGIILIGLLRALLQFNLKYFIRLGILEGWRGIAMALMRSYYEFIIYAKIAEEKEKRKKNQLDIL